MFKLHAGIVLTAIALAGCGSAEPTGTSNPSAAAAATTDGRKPDEVVRVFFEGLRSGDEAKIQQMLTAKARANDLINPEPRNASFQIGEVRYVTDAIAHVPSVWTFFDESGEKIGTDDAIWALRLEPEGWRIAGTMMQVPDLRKMVALDFEDKEAYEDIKRQVEAEIANLQTEGESVARRDAKAPSKNGPTEGDNQAKPDNPSKRLGTDSQKSPRR